MRSTKKGKTRSGRALVKQAQKLECDFREAGGETKELKHVQNRHQDNSILDGY